LSLTTRCYLTLIQRAPRFYRELYRAPVGEQSRRLIRTLVGKSVKQAADGFQPDAVIATHPFPGAAAAYLRQTGDLNVPVFMVLTDFVPHPFWIHAGVDHYFVASANAAHRMIVLGVEPKRISVTGIPVRSAYAKPTPQTHRANPRHVLLMGGGLGLGPIVTCAQSLASLPHHDLKVTIVCGKNQHLYQEMANRFGPDPRFTVLGFVSDMATRILQADLLVTKPGGVTCSEALAVQLPLLLLRPLPGQEEENLAQLLDAGVAELADEPDLSSAVASLLWGPPERLARLRQSAQLMGRPRSAQAIANEIIILSTPNRHKAATG